VIPGNDGQHQFKIIAINYKIETFFYASQTFETNFHALFLNGFP